MPRKKLIRDFIGKELLRGGREFPLDEETNLIESGVVDSLGIQKLVAHLESGFRIEILDEELLPENFETIGAIDRFLERKTGK